MSYSDVYTVSYNCLDVFKTKREAQKFYTTCYHCSEGAEQQRYASVLVNLNFSNLGKDNVSKSCDEIHIKLQGNKDKFITIKLDDYLSIDNTIKYYEENIKPILDISEAYNIDFNNEIPFEYFGSEEEINMYTFSSYYMDIIKKMGIDVKSIVTIEKSAGKYEMKVDENIIDVRAWDKLDDVFENIKTIKELFKEKNKENEYAK